MKNTAEKDQVTLHLIGTNIMWGVDAPDFGYDENFDAAANGNIENAAPPIMAPKRERKAATAQANQGVVRLFKV